MMETLHQELPTAPQSVSRRFLPAALTLAVCLVVPVFLAPQDSGAPARLTYTKFLKGSTPEFLRVSVDSNGEGTYEGRKVDDPPAPRLLKLSPATTSRLFQLAEAMGNFQSVDLESHKNVANLGLKTFVYERDGQTNRTEFNYTQRREAQDLVDLFEKISSVEQHIVALEHAIKYDHLSLPQELLLIRIELDKKTLAEPELMVPALEQIARNPRFLHLAQARAQDILHRLQTNN